MAIVNGRGRVGIRRTSALPSIITNGLRMHLEAGNAASYPGTGTIVTDISGNGKNGTLNNGVLYTGVYGGGFSLDGSNDYISTTLQSFGNSAYSINLTFRIYSFNGSSMRLLGAYSGSTDQLAAGFDSNRLWIWNGSFMYTSFYASTNTVYSIDIIYSAGFSVYVNGVNKGTFSGSSYFANLGLGNPYLNSYGSSFNGMIFSSKMYNRSLSVVEVTQNFNAIKSRYGL